MTNSIDLSVVIPTYNSIAKMDETIRSLDAATQLMNMEVVFVDDGSKDDTFQQLTELAKTRSNWSVNQLEENSGSAAKPRNTGIGLAQGTYIYFLDSDDVLEPKGLSIALQHALKYKYEIVRSSLKVRMGNGEVRIADNIPGWDKIKNPVERKRAITKYQSLTVSFVVLRSVLLDNAIWFDEQRRIGEDIKFTSEVLRAVTKIGFRAIPSRIYVRNAVGEESVTQRISSSQFHDFIKSWNEVEENLSQEGISFVHEHGHSAVQYALRQFLWFHSEPLTEEVFSEFSVFCRRHKEDLRSFKFAPRYRAFIEAAIAGDFASFSDQMRLRLLIAGHDLKFMDKIIQRAQDDYVVRTDKWTGHNIHDEGASKEALAWADLVWAEWLLGAAVWYSKFLRGDQRFIVRAHRSELVANWGEKINLPKVSAVVSIAPSILGDFADRFDIPREKMWLIPNALDVEAYETGEYGPERLKQIAMVGIVPKLKGYKEAIRTLADLSEEFPDLELWVYGKTPEELKWVWEQEDQAAYYKECAQLAEELDVADRIRLQGWVDTKVALSEVAVVCSFSEYEGMQVSVAEGFCSGGLGMTMNWRGARDGFPHEFVFDSREDMVDSLRNVLSGTVDLRQKSAESRDFIKDLYGIDSVWQQIQRMFKSVRA